jgi:DNA polymerase III subunit gamma/tau
MEEQTPYRVLARKYRPSSFEDLIGQEPMVRTLDNAFKTGRIAQAWLLTGVRGVGKTTTARILARALNYETDEINQPSLDLRLEGKHCRAIIESRHVDVIEMDAASNTGINDIREIIESARYRPASARYKVFIIDEVHMLSTAAFNGLLKTLEEPPPHVKFIFATTELRKVPVTVLSRCQRFDLRRIEPAVLTAHLAKILKLEAIDYEEAALPLIFKASEGSVRDALSLLDQAIAHSGGKVLEQTVTDMLGLADASRLDELFIKLTSNDLTGALNVYRDFYDLGVDPVTIFNDLSEMTHKITREKVVPNEASPFIKQESLRLPLRSLSRLWQMLQKGLEEVKNHPRAFIAGEMVLIRIAYASDLPSPEELIGKMQKGETASVTPLQRPPSGGGGATAVAYQPVYQEKILPNSLQAIAELASANREISFKIAIETCVKLVSLNGAKLEIALTPSAPPTLANELQKKLSQWTGERWWVSVSNEASGQTLQETAQSKKSEFEANVQAHPLVKAALELFKGAKVTTVARIATSDVEEFGFDETLQAIEEEED